MTKCMALLLNLSSDIMFALILHGKQFHSLRTRAALIHGDLVLSVCYTTIHSAAASST